MSKIKLMTDKEHRDFAYKYRKIALIKKKYLLYKFENKNMKINSKKYEWCQKKLFKDLSYTLSTSFVLKLI